MVVTGIGLLLFLWFLLCCRVSEAEDQANARRSSGPSPNDYPDLDDEDFGA